MPVAVRIVLVVLASVLAQWGVSSHLAYGPATPDLVLLSVVAVGLLRGPIAGLWSGFGAGALMGSLHGRAMTALILSGVLVGYLSGAMRSGLRLEHRWSAPAAALALTLVGQVAFWMVWRKVSLWSGMTEIGAGAAYNGALMLLLFPLLARAIRPAEGS